GWSRASPPALPGKPLPVVFGDEEGRGFFQKCTVQTQFGVLTAQTLKLCAFIGIEHRASIVSRGRFPGRRTQRPSSCSPTPISAATCATGRPVSITRR